MENTPPLTNGAASDMTPAPAESAKQMPQKPPRARRASKGYMRLVVVVVVLLLAVGGSVYALLTRSENSTQGSTEQPASSFPVQEIALDDLIQPGSVGLSTSQSLSVNGQLRANNSLILAPIDRPLSGETGQLFYDKSGNALAYYNGSQFIDLAGTDDVDSLRNELLTQIQTLNGSIPVVPDVPTDIARQGGDNTFSGTNTFTNGITGTSLALSGGASLQGDLNVSGTTTLGPTTASSLLLSTPLAVGSGGTGTSSLALNGVVVGQGTSALTAVVAGASGQCLMSTAGAPVFQACPGGGGGVNDLNGLSGSLTIANASGVGTTITIDDASTSAKGIASFNATNFSVSSGAVNTIQNIAVSSSPTFAGLTLTAPLAVASGGSGASTLPNNGVLIGQGTAAFIGVTAGAPGECLVSTAGAPTFVACPGASGVSSLNGLTGALTINNASTAGSSIIINDASTSAKGIASFNATNFTASSGAINTIQNIHTAATPTFGGLTTTGAINGQTISNAANFTGSLAVGSTLTVNTITPTGAMTVGSTGQSLTLQGNASTSLAATSGGITNSLVFATPAGSNKTITLPNASGTVAVSASGPIGLDANGNITCATCLTSGGSGVASLNGLTGVLTLNNSSGAGSSITIDNATTSAKGIASFNSTNFSVTAGAVNTIQDISTAAAPTFGGLTVNGTLNTNTITPSGAMTIGSTGQSLSLQGNASTMLSATNGANTTSLTFQSPTANVTYRLQAAAAGTYDVCTTAGNCSGVGGGVTTPGGTVGRLAKFSAAQTLVDSLLSESGSVVTVNGTLAVNDITPTAAMTIGSTGQDLILQGDDSTRLSATAGGITNSLLFTTPSGSNKSITLPNASGTVAVSASGPIALDANGNITCPTCTTSGGGGGGAVDSLNGINGTISIANASAAGSVITIDDASTSAKGIASFNATNFTVTSGAVNTIQNIATTSSPTFNALTLTTPLAISSGGTGAATSQGAINNLSQLTTEGDLLYFNGTNSTRLGRGSNGQCLNASTTTILWGSCGITAEVDTLATVTGRGATTSTAVLLQGGATTRGLTVDTATATDDRIALSVTTGGAARFDGTITSADLTAARTWTLPNEDGTFCLQNSTSCGFALVSGSTAYIQNQNSAQQTSANYWISGTGRADTALQAPTFDTATATTMTLGGNATSISVADDATVAAGKSLTITGGVTGTRPASPAEGMMYFDTTTKQLLTYSNGKWQADRNTSTKIVAANNSSQALKDAADYVADGTGDQTEINAALTAATGGKVYLAEGTYVANATILIPNNTTLAGAGRGTLIELADIDVTDNLIEATDTSTGTGVAIQDLRLDGRKDLNTAGSQDGISFSLMGGGTGSTARQGAKVTNVIVNNFNSDNIVVSNSRNSTFTANTSQGAGADGFVVGGTASNNTFSGNIAQGNGSNGFGVGSSNNNTFTGNTAQGNTSIGFSLSSTTSSALSGNIATGNGAAGFRASSISTNNIFSGNNSTSNTGDGFDVGSDHNSLVGNNALSNGADGFDIGGDNCSLSGNTARTNTSSGINIAGDSATVSGNNLVGNTSGGVLLNSSNNSNVTGNRFTDNGGTTTNNAIQVTSSDNVTLASNTITDSSATTTNNAINISNSTSDNTYLADNTLGTGTISNTGTGTIFGGQVNSSGNYVLQPTGTVEILKNTNLTGNLTVQTSTANDDKIAVSVTTGGAASFTGTITSTDLTAARTWTLPNETGTFCLQSSASCGFATGTAASYIQNQNAGQQTASNFWISGTGRADTALQAPSLDVASAGTLSLGTATATAITLGRSDFTVTANGTINVKQQHLINGTYTTTNNNRLHVTGTLNSSNTTAQYGIQNEVNFDPSGASLSNVYGLVNIPKVSGSALNIGNVHGIFSRVDTTSGYTGTITNASGITIGNPSIAGSNQVTNYSGVDIQDLDGNSGNTSGTLNNHGVLIRGNTAGAGTGGTINNYGIKLTLPSGAGTGTTNNYGLHISGNGGGASSFALYSTSTAASLLSGALTVDGSVTVDLTATATTNGVCHSGAASDTTAQDRALVVCSGAPNDYAEFYPTETNVEAGDLVALTPNMLSYEAKGADAETGEVISMGTKQISILKKATVGDNAIGIISTAPYQTIGKDIPTSAHRMPVALSGRVPLKVNNEGGAIAPGDQLTLSTVAGYATKATQASKTFAVALEPFNEATGTIMVYVQSGYFNPADGDNIQAQSVTTQDLTAGTAQFTNLNVSGPTTLTSLTVTGSATVHGKLTVLDDIETTDIIVKGHIVSGGSTPTIVAGTAACGAPNVSVTGTDTAGTITMTTGAGCAGVGKLATLNFATAFGVAPRITLTPASSASAGLTTYVDNVSAGAFDLGTNTAPASSTEYKWYYHVIQ